MNWNFYRICALVLNYFHWNFFSGKEVNLGNVDQIVAELEGLLDGYIIANVGEGIVIMPKDGNSNPVIISLGSRIKYQSDSIVIKQNVWSSESLSI